MDTELISQSPARSYAWCERLTRRAAKNFYPAFRLLPAPRRRAMCALYAFLRVADDLADSDEDFACKSAQLVDWRASLYAAQVGDYRHPLFPALHDAIQCHDLPLCHLEEALDGVEQDLVTREYETFADLSRYCYLVAGSVGMACVRVWGHVGDSGREAAEAAGLALQLTNILRDVGEDAALGRIYLPREDMERFGCTREGIGQGRYDERFRALMRFQAQRAYTYYDAAIPLAGLLPTPGRAVFLVITRTYRALLDAIVSRDFEVFSSRVRLPRWYKLWLAAGALPVRFGLWT